MANLHGDWSSTSLGIVSEKDLLNASPSPATSLSVWEVTYLLSKITVKDVMSKDVVTVEENTPIETAARIMADGKVAGLPVMRGDEVIGMITETHLFKIAAVVNIFIIDFFYRLNYFL